MINVSLQLSNVLFLYPFKLLALSCQACILLICTSTCSMLALHTFLMYYDFYYENILICPMPRSTSQSVRLLSGKEPHPGLSVSGVRLQVCSNATYKLNV